MPQLSYTSRLSRLCGLFGLLALGLAWLLPNKPFLWISAWNEGAVFVAVVLLGAVAAGRTPGRPGWAWPMVAALCLALGSVWLQGLLGLMAFHGDVLMVSLYLGFLAWAVWVGQCTGENRSTGEWSDALLLAVVLAGLVSVGLMLIQWTQTWQPGVFVLDQHLGGRPYANLGQPNHVNTLCFVAACALLHLHAVRRVGRVTLAAGLALLAFGMALSQSRTAMVQLIVLLAWAVWQSGSLRRWRNPASALAALWLGWTLLLPRLGEWALLQSARGLDRMGDLGDIRLKAWAALWDAVLQRPWLGYGWLQNAWAQQTVAQEHPGLRVEFSYAHNMVLDVLIWMGLPLGLGLLALLLCWGLRHVVSRNPAITWVMAAMLGILVHGLLEFPHAYTYFLLPLGLFAGMVDAWNPVFRRLSLPRGLAPLGALALVLLLAGVGREYVRAMETDTVLRTETLRIGVPGKTTPPPRFALLDQLEAQFDFRFMDPAPGMSAEQLRMMERVSRRHASYAVLTEYAYALGLNGDIAGQQHYLDTVCAMYGENRCVRDMDKWAEQREFLGGRLDVYLANRPGASTAQPAEE